MTVLSPCCDCAEIVLKKGTPPHMASVETAVPALPWGPCPARHRTRRARAPEVRGIYGAEREGERESPKGSPKAHDVQTRVIGTVMDLPGLYRHF